ncbi:MAG TPA: EAL domain-containing protein [Candidatus Eremiobacteraceae bacterium]
MAQAARDFDRQNFQALFGAMDLPMFVYDAVGLTLLDANTSAAALFGRTRQGLLGLRLPDLGPASESSAVARTLRSAGESAMQSVRLTIRKPDGTQCCLDGIAVPMSFAGSSAKLVSIGAQRLESDTTNSEAPVSVEARGRQLRRQDALVEFARTALSGMSGTEVFAAAARLLNEGVPIDYSIGFLRAGNGELRGCAASGWTGDCRSLNFDSSGDTLAARTTRARVPVVVDEIDITDRRPRDPLLAISGVRAAFGIPVRVGDAVYGCLVGLSRTPRRFDREMRFLEAVAGVVSMAADRERAQRGADEAGRRVAEVLDSVAEHFVHVDRDWKITFVNASAADLFSAAPLAMIGKPVETFFPSFKDPAIRRHYDAAMIDQKPSSFDFRSALNARWYDARVRPTSEGIGVFFLDITARREAEEARLDVERRTRVLIDNMPAVTWMTDTDLKIVTSVGGGLRKTGVEDDALVGSNLREMFPKGSDTIKAHERALAGDAADYDDAFGGRTYHSHVEPLRNAEGVIVGVTGLAFDFTDQLAAEHRLEDAQALAQFGAWSFDLVSGDRAYSDELLRIFGRSIAEMPNRLQDFSKLVHGDDAERVRAIIKEAATTGRPWKVDHRIDAGDGSVRYVQNVGRCVVDGGKVLRSYGSVLDITERKLAESELVRLANFDVLTDLPNRAQLAARVARAIGEADEVAKLVAVCCLDIDRFKSINHTLGHEAGDALLRAVGERLSSVVRPGDAVGRLGSDEFAIVFSGVSSDSDSGVISEKLRSAFAVPFEVLGRDIFVTLSGGISFYPKDGGDPDSLLRHADAALQAAKEGGGGQTMVYMADMSAADNAALDLRNRLHMALEREEFRVFFQPILDCPTRRLTGFEALVRWEHPTLGLVAPNDFIPLAEQTGLIVPIGAWVLREACEMARKWRRNGTNGIDVAVNLSARQFADRSLVEVVSRSLRESGLPPENLCLEVTESAVVRDLHAGAATLKSLSATGLSVAIDDFGTGYSSLNYLRSFAFDTLKIDRSFVQGLPANEADTTIARGIIALGHALGMRITAEGVESEVQASFLQREACDSLQGYMIGRPVPETGVAHLIAKYS